MAARAHWDIRVSGCSSPITAVIAYVRNEPRRIAGCGLAISVCAGFVQVFLAVIMIIAGVMLLIGIMQNMDSIFG
mgnify:CR=1 FL=1